MPRKLLKRILPAAHQVRSDKNLRIFGRLLKNPNLWHLNRNSVAAAAAVGLFMAFVPVPFQMVLAAAGAITIGCNLPVAVAMVWITNPVTMPPIFYFAYKLGAWLLSLKPHPIQFEMTFDWLLNKLGAIWEPFLLGCFVLGVLWAAVGYVAVRIVWRVHVVHGWRARKARRARRQSTS